MVRYQKWISFETAPFFCVCPVHTNMTTCYMTKFKSQCLTFLFFKFIWDFLSLLYLSKFQFTNDQPISVADFGWRINLVKRVPSSCLQNLSFFLISIFFKGGCIPAVPLLGRPCRTTTPLFPSVVFGNLHSNNKYIEKFTNEERRWNVLGPKRSSLF